MANRRSAGRKYEKEKTTYNADWSISLKLTNTSRTKNSILGKISLSVLDTTPFLKDQAKLSAQIKSRKKKLNGYTR
jgi:hypothetical protein